MKKTVAALLVSILLYSCGNEDQRPVIAPTDKNTGAQEEIVQRAFGEIMDTCPGIAEYSQSFDAIAATVWNAMRAPYRERDFGWESEIEFVLPVADRPQAGLSDAAGHNLFIYAGAGSRPGIVVVKSFTRRLCGRPETSDDDLFIPIPALAFLVDLH